MNYKDFLSAVAKSSGLSATETQHLADGLTSIISSQLENGNSIQIAGFGTFEVKRRMEKEMVSPSTGKRMLVPPKLVVTFKPIPTLKESVKKGGTDNGKDI